MLGKDLQVSKRAVTWTLPCCACVLAYMRLVRGWPETLGMTNLSKLGLGVVL